MLITPVFALKLFLVPLLILLVTLAGRRWGPAVAGWLSAFPIVAGPILSALTLEQGAAFAARAAEGTLLAVVAILVFSLAYAWASSRCGIANSMARSLLAMFPVMSTVLVGFAHVGSGRDSAVALLRGMVVGYFGFAVFCAVLAMQLREGAVGTAFALALCCALVVHLVARRMLAPPVRFPSAHTS
ncbi:hypothetical protein ACHAC9_06855 [Massilia sp. CMS3.1]|uniref:hypothetical protein n=1 Tax=Massilia sp. CMS3.1 TaxID=3373083 RepID=UPI003EE6B80D